MATSNATVPELKYQKLAGEYAKLRAQALVLKRAVLEEQTETGNLRDHLRQKETALRRAEQEVDSLGFRNKQLEHRVAALQEEIATREGRKREKEDKKRGGRVETTSKNSNINAGDNCGELAQDAIIFEELQKKIMENAQLTSLIDDKERDLQLHAERIGNLEQTLARHVTEQSELEKRLRRDMETLQMRNAELETKLVEAASMFGSEDALSASGSDNTPLHNTTPHTHQQHSLNSSATGGATATTTTVVSGNTNGEERISQLEKEVAHWRAQYEVAKLNATTENSNLNMSMSGPQSMTDANCSCSSTAAGITVKPSYAESKSAQKARDSLKEPPVPPTAEELLYDKFSKKYEDLLKSKCLAESRVYSYNVELEHLQNCLENATHELKNKDEQMQSINQALQLLEEDLTTTRINYEEQISVLTEQVISLSEQLAACK